MIITKQKERAHIQEALMPYRRVFIMGCGECATVCKTGGEREVREMADYLHSQGKTVTGFVVPDAPCIASQVRAACAKNKNAIDEADVILVMACGLGAQSLKRVIGERKTLHVSNDTLFMGSVEKNGVFEELCSACGECLLGETGGICPVTRCAKGLLNGPCGGMNNGKCEVNKDRDCAWVLIYNELQRHNKLHLLKKYNPPKDCSK